MKKFAMRWQETILFVKKVYRIAAGKTIGYEKCSRSGAYII
ncbi:hypothetical protein [uncultured Dubosiella sp.]|nr:hypothetical protein [uncultured Dubosiella sp.]